MAVKNLINLGCLFPQVGCAQFSEKPSVYACLGLKCSEFIGFSGNHAIRCLGDQNSSSNSASELPSVVDNRESSLANKLQKDLSSLPRPLSVSDFSTFPSHGSKVRVSFKGEPGSYSEDAALKAYPQCETVPCNEFEDAFKAVELWIADRAVLPIENSLSGSIHRNYDLLLRHRLHIVGEVQLPVNFCLLALPGIPLERLKRVLSHPQALAQSDNFLSKLGVVRENFEDTAGAAQLVVSKRMFDAGVIATARAAEIYGLNIVAKAIQDEPDNFTRFIILARDPIIPRTDKAFKTSIVFTLEEGPGVIFKALAVFALRDINLTKIESRPQRKQPLRVVDDSNNGTAKYFDYLFYIDFEASMAESRAQNALGHLQQDFATFLRILGSYPIDAAA
ncbi:arogenate dehydratase/prephenate dehydratase 1, chloroplastic-like isoform X1 [Coffea eugenioides]|uniref:Arogenate dehydratase n=1 Tax=Coffea arabica TaxID=13443 RepID=A0ABM4UBY2_COFAR|nr:arogenate dehydratase/prephenate dehydratase 1, chloroplastic-like isoform X1 [Coffea eugenioides]XP_027172763.1 arogenate dehydratase/prephenate dehydratase 1, chloroplastic-like isoform X1 [Coffea eugenioides]XP_027172764.1 arogenate dehydratase/prephenate dehydratase 1, chloroplastic-like isoform X1 [Coffea eugenioides]